MFSVSYAIPWALRPVRTGGLLDLPVRTDTSNVVRYLGGSRGSGGCLTAPQCDVCGLPIKVCRCIAGIDY